MRTRHLIVIVSPHELTVIDPTLGAPVQQPVPQGPSTVDEIAVAARALLTLHSRSPWQRIEATVVLSTPLSQFKRLDGIAEGLSAPDALRALQVGARRFFVHGGTRFAAGSVIRSEGEWWGTAFDEAVVRALCAVLTEARVELRGFVAGAALIRGTRGARDPGASVIDSARELRRSDPLLYDPTAPARIARRRRTWRVALIVGNLLAAVLALLAPGLRAKAIERSIAGRLESPVTSLLEARTEELRRIRARQTTLTDALVTGQPSAAVLADLSRRLPEGSAVVSLRLDQRALDLVLLAPTAVDAVSALQDLRGFSDALVVGAVTRETVDGRSLQRVALRLPRRASPMAAAR